MRIDPQTATRTDGPYRPHTVRLALYDAMNTALTKPGDHLVIETDDPKNMQIVACQVRPMGWKVVTSRSDHLLEMWRVR